MCPEHQGGDVMGKRGGGGVGGGLGVGGGVEAEAELHFTGEKKIVWRGKR